MTIGIGNPYAPSVPAGLLGDGNVAIGAEWEWELRFHQADGTLRRIVRADVPRVPVDDELRDAGLERARASAENTPLTLQQAEEAYGSLVLPDSVPAVGPIVAAGETFWVGRRTGWWWEVGDYDVFDREGRWLSTVTMPPEVLRIFEIGDGYLLAQVADELDVQYMHMYGVEQGS